MRARLVLVPLALAAALLTGCTTKAGSSDSTPTPAPSDNGVSALTADEILKKSQDALSKATSFKFKGQGTEEGQTFSMDLQVAGKNGRGTVDVLGTKMEIIKVDSDLYLKAPDEFWKKQIPAEQQNIALLLLKGKYVKVNINDPKFGGFGSSFEVSEILKPEGAISKGEASSINGTPTITLIDSTTKGKLHIATTGEPYPLRIEPGETGLGNIDFSDFNAAADIKAPAAGEVIDLTALMGG